MVSNSVRAVASVFLIAVLTTESRAHNVQGGSATSSQQSKAESTAAKEATKTAAGDSAAKGDSASANRAAGQAKGAPLPAATVPAARTTDRQTLAIVLVVFFIPFAFVLIRCLAAIANEDGARIESHWGGFGGGLGGWRMSKALMYFVLAIFLAGLFTTTLYFLWPPTPNAASSTQSSPATTKN